MSASEELRALLGHGAVHFIALVVMLICVAKGAVDHSSASASAIPIGGGT